MPLLARLIVRYRIAHDRDVRQPLEARHRYRDVPERGPYPQRRKVRTGQRLIGVKWMTITDAGRRVLTGT
jgi:hypothetical protein